jgi:hypothetical protein
VGENQTRDLEIMAETTPEMVREMAVESQATTLWIIEKQRQLHSMQAHMHAKTPLQKVTDVYIPSVLAVAGFVHSVRQILASSCLFAS